MPNPAPDVLKDTICAVAEAIMLFQIASGINSVEDGETSPGIASFSNDGYSVSYLKPLQAYANMTRQEFDKEVRSIAEQYLSFSELHNDFVFRGIG